MITFKVANHHLEMKQGGWGDIYIEGDKGKIGR